MLAKRLRAQLLAGRRSARDPATVAERLLAIQAQDLRGARLAIRARSHGVTAADVDRALDEERSLVVSWLNRGTLHLVRSEDFHWLHALTTPRLRTGSARRFAEEGVSPAQAERGVGVIGQALASDGPLTRDQIAERLRAARVPTKGQAVTHILLRATLDGFILRGPMLGARQAFALVRDWLGEPPPFDRDVALAELARRYLAGHGPASDRDLARWAGLALRDARAGLAAIAGELTEDGGGLVDLRRRGGRGPAAAPAPRLLGAFEPVLLGWTSRADIVGEHQAEIVSGGVFRPFAIAGGRAVATWRLEGGEISLEPFARIDAAARSALESDAVAVQRFLGVA